MFFPCIVKNLLVCLIFCKYKFILHMRKLSRLPSWKSHPHITNVVKQYFYMVEKIWLAEPMIAKFASRSAKSVTSSIFSLIIDIICNTHSRIFLSNMLVSKLSMEIIYFTIWIVWTRLKLKRWIIWSCVLLSHQSLTVILQKILTPQVRYELLDNTNVSFGDVECVYRKCKSNVVFLFILFVSV